MKQKIFSVISIFAFSLLTPGPARASGFSPLSFTDPCTEQESWEIGSQISPNIAKSFSAFLGGESPYSAMYKAAWFTKSARTLADHLLIAYWKARIHQKIGLNHLALAGFEKITRTLESRGSELTIRMAAIACLNVQKRALPSLSVRPETAAAILALPMLGGARDIAIAREAWFQVFLEALVLASPSDKDATTRASRAADRLRESPAYFSLARGLWALKVNKSGAAVGQFRAYLEEVVKAKASAEADGSARYVDLATFNRARANFQLGDYRAALGDYAKATASLEYYPESLSERSWAALLLRKYDAATGPAFQLQNGDMRALAMSGTHEILGITFYELCDYKAAITEAKNFQKRFSRLHKWLFDWNARVASGTRDDLYSVLRGALTTPDKKVPRMLLTTWVRSPIFTALQKELNSLSDQDIAIRKIGVELRNNRSEVAKALGAGELPIFSALMGAAYQDVTRRITDVTGRINIELDRRTRQLMTDFSASVVNMGLVEAEAYNSMGDRTARKPAGVVAKEEKGPALAEWDWGSLHGDDMDDAEVWDDESGAFRGEVKNRCPKRGGKGA